MKAKPCGFEYGPFGELLRATGPMAKANPFRFSTKYQDDESDLLYYGYRYERDGRWLSRDPVEETGGANLYGFARNDLVNGADFLGLQECCGPKVPVGPDDPPRWCEPGPPKPPKPGDPDQQYPPPPWFLHPPDEGKPCCCTPPAKLVTFKRNDPPPTLVGKTSNGGQQWTIHLSVDIKLEGCYKDLAVIWFTCLRARGDSGYFPDCYNTFTCDYTSYTKGTVGGPYTTHARIRYLSCEGGKWVKRPAGLRTDTRAMGYTWEKDHWVQN